MFRSTVYMPFAQGADLNINQQAQEANLHASAQQQQQQGLRGSAQLSVPHQPSSFCKLQLREFLSSFLFSLFF